LDYETLEGLTGPRRRYIRNLRRKMVKYLGKEVEYDHKATATQES
jgi:hypothetical protein